MNYTQFIEENTLRCEASYRGGGMLGAIQSNANFEPTKKQQKKYAEVCDALERYFHEITNHADDEWETASFEENQNRPTSAY